MTTTRIEKTVYVRHNLPYQWIELNVKQTGNAERLYALQERFPGHCGAGPDRAAYYEALCELARECGAETTREVGPLNATYYPPTHASHLRDAVVN